VFGDPLVNEFEELDAFKIGNLGNFGDLGEVSLLSKCFGKDLRGK